MNQRSFVYGVAALLLFGICYYQVMDADVAPASSAVTTVNAASFAPTGTPAAVASVQWMSWEDALAANKANPKKMVVDVYTDWCGWCKRMDATTFKDPKVAAYISEHFYAIKLNAEQKEDITYDGHTFSYQRQGKRGVHGLAASLLDNRLSYPSVVYLNGDMERIMISPGYKDAEKFLQELKYANGEVDKP